LRSNFLGAAIQDVWGVFWVLGFGWGRGGRDLVCFNSGYHNLGLLKVKSQPEDGPHIGPKHVVVSLLYY